MRELNNLSPSEKEILKKLADSKKKNSDAGLQNYQSGRILEQSAGFNFAAIKWNKDGVKPIQIYYEDTKDKQGFYSNLFILYDYLLFLEELEKERLIVVLSAKLEEEQEEERILFNRQKYDNKEVFNSWQLNDSIKGFIFWDNTRKEYKSWIDIASYLEKYVYLKIIYPTSALESFVKNGFKTQEQIRHNEEMGNLNKQLKNTSRSLTITAFTLIATIIFGTITQCSSTKIESDKLKTIALSSQNLPKPEPPCITINLVDSVTSSNNSITMNAPIGH